MIGHSSEQLSFGEGFIDPALFELNEELSHVDVLLREPSLLKPFEEVFDDHMGRPGTPVDVYLRMLFLKFRYGLSYEEVQCEVGERLPWRRFCHLSLMDSVPDSTTLIKLNQRFGEEHIRQLNTMLVKHLVKTKSIKPRKIRIDSTTIETQISYPNDVKLLHSVIKTVTRTVQKAGGKIRNHVRSAKKTLAALGQSLKSSSGRSKVAFKKHLRKVAALATDTVKQSRAIVRHFDGRDKAVLEKQLGVAEQILEQTEKKLSDSKATIPERIVSFHDPEVRPIRKGKLGKPTEFGRTLQLVQDESGVILDYQINHGNPNDKTQAVPMVKRVKKIIGRTPDSVAADKGFYSAANIEKLKTVGVKHVGIAKIGRLSKRERRRQRSSWFRKLQRFRCGIEAAISMLKRGFSLSKIPSFGASRSAIWVGFALFSYNIWQIA